MKNKSWIQIAVFLLFIVLIPLGSYYYLKRGYDYRKEAMEKMKDIGPLPAMDFTTIDGRKVVKDSLLGRMVIANVIPLQDKELAAEFGQTMRRLYDQFEETGRLVMLIFGADPAYDGEKALRQFAQQHELYDKPFLYWIAADSNGLEQAAEQLYLPENGQPQLSYFALCDTTQMVRNHYSISTEDAIKEMVTHTAMFLPLKPRKRVMFKRETEK